jgi:uncharacterized Zn-binding protein involved in type VI secretion
MCFPQARVTDPHICPATLGAPTPILPPCALTVLVMGLPAARLTDLCTGVLPPAPHPIAKGSVTVMIMGLPAARMAVDPCSAGGVIAMGAPTVLTGG